MFLQSTLESLEFSKVYSCLFHCQIWLQGSCTSQQHFWTWATNRNCKPMPAHTEDIRCSWFHHWHLKHCFGEKKLDNQAQGKHWLALTHPSCNIPVFSNHMKSRKRKSRRPKLLKPSQETPRFLLTFQVLKIDSLKKEKIVWQMEKKIKCRARAQNTTSNSAQIQSGRRGTVWLYRWCNPNAVETSKFRLLAEMSFKCICQASIWEWSKS